MFIFIYEYHDGIQRGVSCHRLDWAQAFLKGETQIAADEAFQNAVHSYQEVFLRSERVQRMVASGACSAHDFREVFRANVDKRVRSLPEMDGLSKETVLGSWMTKFDAIFRGDEDTRSRTAQQQQQGRGALLPHGLASELLLSKEQLYEMFQGVLNIKKFEHQLLYNALQVPDGGGVPQGSALCPALFFLFPFPHSPAGKRKKVSPKLVSKLWGIAKLASKCMCSSGQVSQCACCSAPEAGLNFRSFGTRKKEICSLPLLPHSHLVWQC